jgi:hypothetical protein
MRHTRSDPPPLHTHTLTHIHTYTHSHSHSHSHTHTHTPTLTLTHSHSHSHGQTPPPSAVERWVECAERTRPHTQAALITFPTTTRCLCGGCEALKLIAPGKLTFDDRVALQRVVGRVTVGPPPFPLSSEHRTYKTVTAGFWPWLPSRSP